MLPEARTAIFEAAAQFHHPHIINVHEVGRQNGIVFIVSDFVEGLNLADWHAERQLSAREAAELCAKLAEALNHAHQAGVIHRDLKPSNIMIDVEGNPHLVDFGLARRQVGEVTLWDMTSSDPTCIERITGEDGIYSVAFSPDNRLSVSWSALLAPAVGERYPLEGKVRGADE